MSSVNTTHMPDSSSSKDSFESSQGTDSEHKLEIVRMAKSFRRKKIMNDKKKKPHKHLNQHAIIVVDMVILILLAGLRKDLENM